MKIIDLQREDFQVISSPTFLQSYQWSEIQKNFGHQVFLKGIKEGEKLIGFFLAIENIIFGNKKYWYLPRGPIFLDSSNDINKNYEKMIIVFNQIIIDNNLSFIRFEPILNNFEAGLNNFIDFYHQYNKNIKISYSIQPSKTRVLNLSQNEDDLMTKMNQKTRYNIRLAQKKDVNIFLLKSNSVNDFWNLISLTSERDKFFIHSKNYYSNLINYNNNFIRVFEARYNDMVLAMGIFSFYGDTVSYLHGASSNEWRNLMAPHLLQWEVIKLAKQEGFKYYDFYGVDEKKWPGVSRFKNGFGGFEVIFPGTFDYVSNNNSFDKFFYNVYKISRKVKRILR